MGIGSGDTANDLGVVHHTVWELSCGSLWAAPDRLSPWQGRGTEVEGGVLGGEGFG